MTDVRRYMLVALIGTLIPVAVVIGLTLMATGGVWEYALDDAYIHLAMSEEVARGGYGVNAGEPASASSSILYTWLLAPLAGSALHAWEPLMLGLLGAVLFALLWGRVMAMAAEEAVSQIRWMPLVLALLAPVLMNVPAMAVIGMEHMLHIVATLAVLVGLLTLAWDGRIGVLLILGLVLNPALRFEGLAVLVLGCGVIALSGRPAAGAMILLVGMVPLVLHGWYMSTLGLDWLPNSVNAKAAVAGGGDRLDDTASRLDLMTYAWRQTLASRSGRLLLGCIFAGAVGVFLARRQITGTFAHIGWMAVLLALAHVTFGSTLWYWRYEVYAWVFAVGAAAVLVARLRIGTSITAQTLALLLTGGVAFGGAHYVWAGFVATPQGSAAIAAQQRQMGRFVDEVWRAPVAVNDLGHVAYANPHYVLDLWGLANADALAARLSGDDPLWADRLAERHGVKVAMIYDHALGGAIGPDWVKVAELTLTIPQATLGGPVVSIYATDADAAAPLRAALEQFAPTLPGSAVLTFMEGTDR